MLRYAAKQKGEWSGIPMPLEDLHLTIEPSYPYAKELAELSGGSADKSVESDGKYVVRNAWYSKRKRIRVGILGHKGDDKKPAQLAMAPANQITALINTIGASYAWGIEQEHKALTLLASMVKHHTFKQYMLTGAFMETSKRSGVTYVFRRLRPTIALKADAKTDSIKILCTLCMHPIGYYQDSWGGAMCPTDDVICHLALMRGDEHTFWKRCNQHPHWHPNSGI